MPFWLNNTTGAAYAPVGQNQMTSPTLGSASALYQAMLSSQTQTTSSGLYNWAGLSNATTTATTTSSTNSVWANVYWIEDEVEHTQYVALAQQRAARWTAQQIEESRRYDEDRLRMRAEQQREQHRLAQERSAALARSKELLLAHLTPAQRKTFEDNRWFVVEGGRSKQLYRVRDSGSYSANVDVLEGRPGKVTHRLCCHLSDSRVPLYDHLLAQKVWIEHDEDAFLRQANRHAA